MALNFSLIKCAISLNVIVSSSGRILKSYGTATELSKSIIGMGIQLVRQIKYDWWDRERGYQISLHDKK